MTPVHPIAIALLPEITNIQFTAHVLIAPHVSDKRLHSAVQLLTAIHLLSDVKKTCANTTATVAGYCTRTGTASTLFRTGPRGLGLNIFLFFFNFIILLGSEMYFPSYFTSLFRK